LRSIGGARFASFHTTRMRLSPAREALEDGKRALVKDAA